MRTAKARKLLGWDKGSLSEEKEGRRNKSCKGNHHLPEVDLCPPSPSVFVAEHDVVWLEYPFGQFWPTVLTASSASFLPPLAYLLEQAEWGKIKPWCCASNAQQKPKYWCVISTVLATNPKQSTIWAAMKKVTSIPARPSTVRKQYFLNLLLLFWYFHSVIYFLFFFLWRYFTEHFY